jgi:hypothetical protein
MESFHQQEAGESGAQGAVDNVGLKSSYLLPEAGGIHLSNIQEEHRMAPG